MMSATLNEMRKQRKEAERQKKADYKHRATLRPKMGSWHTITEHAWKDNENDIVTWRSDPIEDGKSLWNWEKQCHEKPSNPITSYRALYIGYRYKFDGFWDNGRSDYGDEYPYFRQTETVEVWMFVTHDNRNPIPVFPFDVDKSEEVE